MAQNKHLKRDDYVPEVVEVQIQVDGLKQIEGYRIDKVHLHEGHQAVFDGDYQRFYEGILDQCLINKVYRKGKHIIVELLKEHGGGLKGPETQYWYLVVHLSLNGAFLIDVPSPHQRLEFELSRKNILGLNEENHSTLIYRDIMKRGSLRLYTAEEVLKFFKRTKLGVDVLDSNAFDIERGLVTNIYHGVWKTMPIHQALLDQKLISGLGNIYVNEVLWWSQIHPLTPAGMLDFGQYKDIANSIRKVIRDSYKNGGSSIKDYVHTDGKFGEYQKLHKVYGKDFCHCDTCADSIRKIKIDERSAFFCPTCQEMKK